MRSDPLTASLLPKAETSRPGYEDIPTETFGIEGDRGRGIERERDWRAYLEPGVEDGSVNHPVGLYRSAEEGGTPVTSTTVFESASSTCLGESMRLNSHSPDGRGSVPPVRPTSALMWDPKKRATHSICVCLVWWIAFETFALLRKGALLPEGEERFSWQSPIH